MKNYNSKKLSIFHIVPAIKSIVKLVVQSIAKWFFNPRCPVCFQLQETDNICHDCFNQIDFLSSGCIKCQELFEYHIPSVDLCEKCANESVKRSSYNTMQCAVQYNETIKNLIIRFKNQQDFGLVQLFAKWIINKQGMQNILQDVILVPVPLYKKRLIRRGYNQSLILVKEIARLTNLPYMNILERKKNTNTQATKTIEQRFDNVKDAFVIADKYKNFVANKRFVIVDDVITTGATMLECAKALKGAGNIDLVSIARRMRKPKIYVDLSKEEIG